MILVSVIVLFGLYPSLMLDVVQTAALPLINGLPR
jgi:NADH-quinone oxidoreductase subunit M